MTAPTRIFFGLTILLAGFSAAHASVLCAASIAPVTVDSVAQTSASTWSYGFSVTNNGYFLAGYPGCQAASTTTSYMLPYFSDAGITAVTAPVGWNWRIDTADTFNLGNGAQTLTWYTSDIANGIVGQSVGIQSGVSGQTLTGFGFSANFAPVKSPDAGVSNFQDSTIQFGDPALPGSQSAQSAGLTNALPYSPLAAVPEPSSFALLALGLGLLLVARRRSSRD